MNGRVARVFRSARSPLMSRPHVAFFNKMSKEAPGNHGRQLYPMARAAHEALTDACLVRSLPASHGARLSVRHACRADFASSPVAVLRRVGRPKKVRAMLRSSESQAPSEL